MLILLIVVSLNVSADPSHPQIIFKNLKISTSEYTDVSTNYPLYQIIDGDFSTAWVFNEHEYNKEGKKQKIKTTIPRWIKVESLNENKIKTIFIVNGYAKSRKLYNQNNIITQIKVKTLNDYESGWLLDKSMEFQKIILNEPAKMVKLNIYKQIVGSKYYDTCISEIKILNENNRNMLKNNNFFIYSESGEYPSYKIMEMKDMEVIYDPDSYGITEAGFSPLNDKLFLLYSEIDGSGFDIYNVETKEVNHYLEGKYVLDFHWINNTRVKVHYYEYNGDIFEPDKGNTIINIR